MQFSIIALVSAAVLAAPTLAQSVHYSGFSSTVSCSGSSFGCTDGGAVCCSLPTGFGYSVQFTNLPAGSQGQGYADGGCAHLLFALFGPGTKCWSGGGASAANMNLFHSPQRGRREVNLQDKEIAGRNCSRPTVFVYEGMD